MNATLCRTCCSLNPEFSGKPQPPTSLLATSSWGSVRNCSGGLSIFESWFHRLGRFCFRFSYFWWFWFLVLAQFLGHAVESRKFCLSFSPSSLNQGRGKLNRSKLSVGVGQLRKKGSGWAEMPTRLRRLIHGCFEDFCAADIEVLQLSWVGFY